MIKPIAKPKPALPPVIRRILAPIMNIFCAISFSVKAPFMLYYGAR